MYVLPSLMVPPPVPPPSPISAALATAIATAIAAADAAAAAAASAVLAAALAVAAALAPPSVATATTHHLARVARAASVLLVVRRVALQAAHHLALTRQHRRLRRSLNLHHRQLVRHLVDVRLLGVRGLVPAYKWKQERKKEKEAKMGETSKKKEV